MRATPVELGTAPSLELVRDGCGRGWHRTRWRDQWGYWQPEGNNPAYHFLGQKEQRGSEGEQRQLWCPPLRDRWFADSPLEEDGFELVWGFSCQVVVLGFAESSLFGAGKPFFIPSPAIRSPERAEGVKGPKR